MTQQQPLTPAFKARIVLEILTGAKQVAESSREYGVPEAVIKDWVQLFMRRAARVFEEEPSQPGQEPLDPEFVASLERSLKDNRDIWEELAKH